MSDDLSWETRAGVYREEAPVSRAIESSKKIKVDLSLLQELRDYFPRLRESDEGTRRIRGPADLDLALKALDEIHGIKDRSAEIIMVYTDYKSRLERLFSIVETQLLTKREVLMLKNDAQRKAVISITAPEIADRLSKVTRILHAAETVSKNINQSFNIVRAQADIVKEMMYEAGLTGATKRMTTQDRS